VILRRFALSRAAALLAGIEEVTAVSPFRHMVTPGGYTMSVAMTNCGELGWATNERGYLYAPNDPDRSAVASHACGFPGTLPRGCRGGGLS
jgi:alkylated DNA repair protein (DNA oxidative demethylase)